MRMHASLSLLMEYMLSLHRPTGLCSESMYNVRQDLCTMLVHRSYLTSHTTGTTSTYSLTGYGSSSTGMSEHWLLRSAGTYRSIAGTS